MLVAVWKQREYVFLMHPTLMSRNVPYALGVPPPICGLGLHKLGARLAGGPRHISTTRNRA